MKKYLWIAAVLYGFMLSYKVMADEDQQDTSSGFVGNMSNSIVDESWGQENVQEKTDSPFVGSDTINASNSYFAGDSYQEQVGNGTVAPFAGDRSFVGNEYGQ